jgi:hypothetical protein
VWAPLALVLIALAVPGFAGGESSPVGGERRSQVTLERGKEGGEPWRLVAHAGEGRRCLDVLFRHDPCRGCGSSVPGRAEVEVRRHTYLEGEQFTFVVVEASRRVARVRLTLEGRGPVEAAVRDPFRDGGRRPWGVRDDFRYAIVPLQGEVFVSAVEGFNRHGRLVERREG